MKNKKLLVAGMAFIMMFTPMLAGCEEAMSNVIVSVLTGFEKAPVPTIKEGRFNFSVTYELGGEVKTMSSVYVCKYAGGGMYLDGWYIEWEEYVEDSEIEALYHNENYYGGFLMEENEVGAIYLDLNLSSEYFMSEPGYNDEAAGIPYMFMRYNDELAEESGVYWEDDPAVLETYGAKIISYEYDAPLENIYK